MSDFKIGDKVRVTDNTSTIIEIGDTGTVVNPSVAGFTYLDVVDVQFDSGLTLLLRTEQVQLVNEDQGPKIGDRVALTEVGTDACDLPQGAAGVVETLPPHANGYFEVLFEGQRYPFLMARDEIELIAEVVEFSDADAAHRINAAAELAEEIGLDEVGLALTKVLFAFTFGDDDYRRVIRKLVNG